MIIELILAVIQAATEFLPVSSSGHLALFSILFNTHPDLFFITLLHIASMIAVLIFVRKEILELLKFNKEAIRLWLFIIIATIPGALLGFLLKDQIESAFSSVLFLGLAFLFTGTIILLTKIPRQKKILSLKSSVFVGLSQAIALFPGVSRSGMSVSAGLFNGLEKEKAVKFSFLLFIPLSLGALLLELKDFYAGNISLNMPVYTLFISFIVCFAFSLVFLNVLMYVIKKGEFWVFSIYCYILGLFCLALHLIK
jgi:undecaprenyl-diphosphatase